MDLNTILLVIFLLEAKIILYLAIKIIYNNYKDKSSFNLEDLIKAEANEKEARLSYDEIVNRTNKIL